MSFLGMVLGSAAVAALESAEEPASEDPAANVQSLTRDDICALIDTAAAEHDLPVEFFTRLIWQESRFRIGAVSPKGALGVAQFMPGTAAERGLSDPFDPEQAIPASAGFLVELAGRFGNLGLAAAAYNAGPQRVSDWLYGRGGLPGETRHYVQVITGLEPEAWSRPDDEAPQDNSQEAALSSCLEVVAALGTVAPQMVATARAQGTAPSVRAPWGVQVAGGFSQAVALAHYRKLKSSHPRVIGDTAPMVVPTRNRSRGRATFFEVRLPADTRQQAGELCRRLQSIDASCLIRRN